MDITFGLIITDTKLFPGQHKSVALEIIVTVLYYHS